MIAYKIFENYGQNRILLKTINLGVPFHGLFGKGCEVWKYNHTNDQWIPIISDIEGANLPSGFGHHDNFGAAIIKSFQDNLHIGIASSSLLLRRDYTLFSAYRKID
ncbi:MAG: hypothetical protein KAJ69_00920 [Thermoplasmatales archaeon]|nr:hypothetical protein [Thermoplasmatales archaeon]